MALVSLSSQNAIAFCYKMGIEELAIFCCNSFKTTQILPVLEREQLAKLSAFWRLKIPQASTCTAEKTLPLGPEAFKYVM